MNVAARALVDFTLSAGGLALLLLVAALWVNLRPRSTRSRRFLLLVAVCYALMANLAVTDGLARLFARGLKPFTVADAPSARVAIVILGSGSITVRDWHERQYAFVDRFAAARVVEAARVYALTNADWIVSSGGKVRPNDPYEATGTTMRDALVALGIPGAKIIVETRSRNTREEAVIVAGMLRERNIDRPVLITSTLHMRRALGAFRAQGMDAVPAIARDPVSRTPWGAWLVPSDEGLSRGWSLAHEGLGIAYYWARGWYRTP